MTDDIRDLYSDAGIGDYPADRQSVMEDLHHLNERDELQRESGEPAQWFVTVDWLERGRGLFACADGKVFSSPDRPHTEAEMIEMLGSFHLLANPQSVLMTKSEWEAHILFVALPEYSLEYGVALKSLPSTAKSEGGDSGAIGETGVNCERCGKKVWYRNWMRDQKVYGQVLCDEHRDHGDTGEGGVYGPN